MDESYPLPRCDNGGGTRAHARTHAPRGGNHRESRGIGRAARWGDGGVGGEERGS